MQNINAKIQDVLRRHKNKKQYLFVLFLLSVMVITAVCFSLMSPAVSMSGERVCMKEEHLHNSSCYAQKLVCTENTEGHSHSDNCFKTETTVVCGLEEDENHSHSEECYKDEEVLICEIPENEGHVHTDECYTNEVICGQEEHVHSADCYDIDTRAADKMSDEDEVVISEEETVDLPDNLIQSVSINDGEEYDPDKGFDFKDRINNVTWKYSGVDETAHESWIGTENHPYNQYYYKNIGWHMDFNLPAGFLNLNQRKIYYKLPENIIIPFNQKGYLDNDREKGSYEITTEGFIIIEFTQSYINKYQSSQIEGCWIEFNSRAYKLNDNNGFETYDFNSNVKKDLDFMDLTIDKIPGNYDKSNKTQSYTIKISSKLGSGNNTITFTDSLISSTDYSKKDITFFQWHDGQEVEITLNHENNGSSKIKATVNISENNGKKVVTIDNLPGLNKGEYYTFNYNVKLDTDSAELLDTKTIINNEAKATNKKLTDTSTKEVPITFSNVGISKSHIYSNQTIHWEVTVNNPDGDLLSDYSVKDIMFPASGLTINGNDFLNYGTLNDNVFKFNADQNGTSYVFRYDTTLTDEIKQNENGITNTADLLKKHIKITDVSDTYKYEAIDIEKSGVQNSNKSVIWTITVNNPSEESLEGYSITDSMFSEAIDNIKVNDQLINENIGTIDGNTFTFSVVSGKSYVFTYETLIDQSIKTEGSGSVENTVQLKKDDAIIDEDDATVPIEFNKNKVIKKVNQHTINDSGNLDIPWTVYLGFAYDFESIDFEDSMSLNWSDEKNCHYMTKEQIKNIVICGKTDQNENIEYSTYDSESLILGTDYELIINGEVYSSLDDIDALKNNFIVDSFKIKFKDNETNKKYYGFKIDYLTTGKVDDLSINGQRTFKNTSTFGNGSGNAEDWYQKPKPFQKGYCTQNEYKFDSSKEYNLNDLVESDTAEILQLKWFIRANENKDYPSSQNITFTDTLPSETYIDLESVVFKCDNMSIKNNEQGFTVIKLSSENKYEFNVPASLHNGKKFDIEYTVNVPKSQWDNISEGNSKEFTNTVADNINTSYDATQTQKVKVPNSQDNTPKIEKRFASDERQTNIIDFIIDVNPNRVDIDPESDQIKVKDYLNRWAGISSNVCYVVLKSINVYEVDIEGNESLVSSSEYILNYLDNSNPQEFYFEIILRDNRYYRIKSQYYYQYEEEYLPNVINGENGGLYLKNEAEIYKMTQYGDKYITTSGAVGDKFLLYNSGGGAGARVNIEKIDSANAALRLNGAEFAFLRYNVIEQKWEVFTGYQKPNEYKGDIWNEINDPNNPTGYYALATKDNGSIETPSLDGNYIYKIIETKAPEGYSKSSSNYYFTFNSKIPDTLPEGIISKDDIYMAKGDDIIRIENQRMLPATGGVGTKPYIITGIAIMSGSVILYLCCKRHRRRIK